MTTSNHPHPFEGPFFSPREAAKYLDLDEGTLANWRASGIENGLPYVKLGTSRTAPIRYPKPALDAWMAQRLVVPGA